MRLTLIVALATLPLLTACEKQAAPVAKADSTATKAPADTLALATMPTEALTGDAARAVMDARHESFEAIGDEMKILSREAKAEAPDMAKVKTSSAKILASASALPGWFAPGTGPDVANTEAKAIIWQQQDDFAVKAKGLHTAALALDAAAGSGDAAQFKTAMGSLGKACKACHVTYRAED